LEADSPEVGNIRGRVRRKDDKELTLLHPRRQVGRVLFAGFHIRGDQSSKLRRLRHHLRMLRRMFRQSYGRID
jgi:hypothetical protein